MKKEKTVEEQFTSMPEKERIAFYDKMVMMGLMDIRVSQLTGEIEYRVNEKAQQLIKKGWVMVDDEVIINKDLKEKQK